MLSDVAIVKAADQPPLEQQIQRDLDRLFAEMEKLRAIAHPAFGGDVRRERRR